MPIRNLQDYIAKAPAPPQPFSVTDTQTRNPVVATARIPVSPFAALDVWYSINGITVVTWQQNPNFLETVPLNTQLILEFSPNLMPDNWLLVSEQPLTYYLEDKIKRFHGQTIQGAYRLKLKHPNFEYLSEPTRLFQKYSFTEYKVALKILRAENRQLYHKSPGYLLKRRQMGVRCTSCNDFLTNVAKQEQCSICYGTGFIGGYFVPVQCGMEITLQGSEDQVDPARGPVNDQVSVGRMTALYSPEQNDVWVDSTSGRRYRVVSNKVTCQQRSVPLVLAVNLKHIPASDAVYGVKAEI